MVPLLPHAQAMSLLTADSPRKLAWVCVSKLSQTSSDRTDAIVANEDKRKLATTIFDKINFTAHFLKVNGKALSLRFLDRVPTWQKEGWQKNSSIKTVLLE